MQSSIAGCLLVALMVLNCAFAFTPTVVLQRLCKQKHQSLPSYGMNGNPTRRIQIQKLHMRKEGDGGKQNGFGAWIQNALRENMGLNEDRAVKIPQRQEIASDDEKRAKNLLDLDTSGIMEAATPSQSKTPEGESQGEAGVDRRFYEVTLDRPTGLEFATDLSLKYVYVMEIKENSAADLAPVPIDVGDQLVAINGDDCLGLPFSDVANLLGKDASKSLTFRFFRGNKQELLQAVGREDYVPTVARLTGSVADGNDDEFLVVAAAGANMRDALMEGGVQVYKVQSGRFTNCNGKQLCGTCIVDVKEGAEFTNSKSIDEANFLRKMPDTYRLSCCVNVYGNVKLETMPKTNKKFIEFS